MFQRQKNSVVAKVNVEFQSGLIAFLILAKTSAVMNKQLAQSNGFVRVVKAYKQKLSSPYTYICNTLILS